MGVRTTVWRKGSGGQEKEANRTDFAVTTGSVYNNYVINMVLASLGSGSSLINVGRFHGLDDDEDSFKAWQCIRLSDIVAGHGPDDSGRP